mmetsp:Transcript_47760/g.63090  ORF Transcript_47760/g.63090 Transcript_47760/m.63090 type:complete len:249 (-) Transcript_47760:2186-2932(-)
MLTVTLSVFQLFIHGTLEVHLVVNFLLNKGGDCHDRAGTESNESHGPRENESEDDSPEEGRSRFDHCCAALRARAVECLHVARKRGRDDAGGVLAVVVPADLLAKHRLVKLLSHACDDVLAHFGEQDDSACLADHDSDREAHHEENPQADCLNNVIATSLSEHDLRQVLHNRKAEEGGNETGEQGEYCAHVDIALGMVVLLKLRAERASLLFLVVDSVHGLAQSLIFLLELLVGDLELLGSLRVFFHH